MPKQHEKLTEIIRTRLSYSALNKWNELSRKLGVKTSEMQREALKDYAKRHGANISE